MLFYLKSQIHSENCIIIDYCFYVLSRVEPPSVPLLPAASSKPKVSWPLLTGGLKASTVITILIALLAALYVSAALMMIRIDRLHTAYVNHPLVSPERFTQERLLHYLNSNLDQIIKVQHLRYESG